MNIYIMGGMGSGKTTVANHLRFHLKNTKKLTLADPIKDIVRNIDIMSNVELLDSFIKPFYTTSPTDLYDETWYKIFYRTREIPLEGGKERKRLQYLGTEGARKQIADDIWIQIAFGKAALEPEVIWVVDDCRFKNEAESFSKAGWLPIYLHIEPKLQIDRLIELYQDEFDPLTLNHDSEKELKNILIPTKCIFYSHDDIERTLKNIKAYVWEELHLS